MLHCGVLLYVDAYKNEPVIMITEVIYYSVLFYSFAARPKGCQKDLFKQLVKQLQGKEVDYIPECKGKAWLMKCSGGKHIQIYSLNASLFLFYHFVFI